MLYHYSSVKLSLIPGVKNPLIFNAVWTFAFNNKCFTGANSIRTCPNVREVLFFANKPTSKMCMLVCLVHSVFTKASKASFSCACPHCIAETFRDWWWTILAIRGLVLTTFLRPAIIVFTLVWTSWYFEALILPFLFCTHSVHCLWALVAFSIESHWFWLKWSDARNPVTMVTSPSPLCSEANFLPLLQWKR